MLDLEAVAVGSKLAAGTLSEKWLDEDKARKGVSGEDLFTRFCMSLVFKEVSMTSRVDVVTMN